MSQRNRLSALRHLLPLKYEDRSPKGFGTWTNGSSRVDLADNGRRCAHVLLDGSVVANIRRGFFASKNLRKGVTLRHGGEELVVTGHGRFLLNTEATVDWRSRRWLVKHTSGSGVLVERDLIDVTAVTRNRPLASDAATAEDLAVLFVVGYSELGVLLAWSATLVSEIIPWYTYPSFPRAWGA